MNIHDEVKYRKEMLAGGPGSGRHPSGLGMTELKRTAGEATKTAKQSGSKEHHARAADLHNEYADRLADRMSSRGVGFSHTLGYHSDMADYHKAAARGKQGSEPRKYNPRNDPGSRSFRGGDYYGS